MIMIALHPKYSLYAPFLGAEDDTPEADGSALCRPVYLKQGGRKDQGGEKNHQ